MLCNALRTPFRTPRQGTVYPIANSTYYHIVNSAKCPTRRVTLPSVGELYEIQGPDLQRSVWGRTSTGPGKGYGVRSRRQGLRKGGLKVHEQGRGRGVRRGYFGNAGWARAGKFGLSGSLTMKAKVAKTKLLEFDSRHRITIVISILHLFRQDGLRCRRPHRGHH